MKKQEQSSSFEQDFESLEKLRQYAVSQKVLDKIIKRHEDSFQAYPKALVDNIIKSSEGRKMSEEDASKINSMLEGLEPLVIEKNNGDLYAIYFKGIPLEEIKTIGGKAFNEIVASQVGIYNPIRQSSIGNNRYE